MAKPAYFREATSNKWLGVNSPARLGRQRLLEVRG